MRNGAAGQAAADWFCDPAELQAVPTPRGVLARAPRPWGALEAVAHTDGLIVDAATAETLSAAAAAAFWTRSRRDPLVIVTDAPAALARDVEAAGGVWQGHLYRRRGWQSSTGCLTRGEAEKSSIKRVKLPGSDRWATVVCSHLFLDDLPPEDAAARARRLVRFARDYLDWCQDHGWAPRPSRGSWGAAFLRDPRFWPAARRKVPRCFNRIARRHLPGNHYERLSDEAGAPAAVEVDMSGAHHQSALRARFPHPDRVSKAGSWREDSTRTTGCGPGHPNWPAALRSLARPGLFKLRMSFPPLRGDELAPPWWPRAGGEAVVVVWSPELPDALAHGASVLGVIASMAAAATCDGLNRFAAWAQTELEAADPYRRTWLKGALLAAYGVLAQGARAPSVVSSAPTKHSTPADVVIAGELVSAHVATSRRAAEPGYVDAIARGIIEAETRAELLRAGDALAGAVGRERMLALYADSAIVKLPLVQEADIAEMMSALAGVALTADRASALDRLGTGAFLADWKNYGAPNIQPTPSDYDEWFAMVRLPGLVADFLGPGWRVKRRHTQLTFHVPGSATHWTSDQDDKRPGVPRRGRPKAREPA